MGLDCRGARLLRFASSPRLAPAMASHASNCKSTSRSPSASPSPRDWLRASRPPPNQRRRFNASRTPARPHWGTRRPSREETGTCLRRGHCDLGCRQDSSFLSHEPENQRHTPERGSRLQGWPPSATPPKLRRPTCSNGRACSRGRSRRRRFPCVWSRMSWRAVDNT